jgi:mannosyltransferase PIG-V
MNDASQAVRTSAAIFLLSRAWILVFALLGLHLFGVDAGHYAEFASPGVEPFAVGGQDPISIWSRWDSVWYLEIANLGYTVPGSEVFFPLYPMVSRVLGELANVALPLPDAVFLASLAIALACFAGGLYLLHRLTELESDREVATLTVGLVAFFPMALFFGAIYTEGPFLLLSVAAFWFARNDRWAAAGIAGGLAAATRSTGLLLLVPLGLIYLLGPRGTGPQARPYLGLPWRRPPGTPRSYPLGAEALWILLIPAAVVAYMVYLGLSHGNAFELSDAQATHWGRELRTWAGIPVGPLAGLAQGVEEAVRGIGVVIGDPDWRSVWAPDGGNSLRRADVNLEAGVFTVLGLVALVGVMRRLPVAYGAYAGLAIALPLSFPVKVGTFDVPLFSMPRFLAVVFPLFIWLAMWVRERGLERPALALSAILLALYSAQWATYQWVS